MATLHFTANLIRHVDCPSEVIDAASVTALLDDYFNRHPDVRGYVLDDQGRVRHHVKILIDGLNLRDRERQSDAIRAESQVHVFQALSGG